MYRNIGLGRRTCISRIERLLKYILPLLFDNNIILSAAFSFKRSDVCRIASTIASATALLVCEARLRGLALVDAVACASLIELDHLRCRDRRSVGLTLLLYIFHFCDVAKNK